MKAKKTWGWKTAIGSANSSRTILATIEPATLFAMLALTVWCGMRSEPTSAAAPAAPTYEIAFSSLGPINADMFIADADGNNAKPLLPHAGFDGNGSFSRDGKWIVFTSERDGSYDIYRARPDGSGLERLVDDPAYDDQAALSPDGKSLAFVSTRNGQADIWILELATKKLRNLTSHPAGDFRPRGRRMDSGWLSPRIGIRGNRSGHLCSAAIDRDLSDPRRRNAAAARHTGTEVRRQSNLVGRRQAPALLRGGAWRAGRRSSASPDSVASRRLPRSISRPTNAAC